MIDELHVMLRISDWLKAGIIMEILKWDKEIFSVLLPESQLY